ncbi:MAG: hypothetical protein AAF092_10255 [Pseudomonadota bacterium]
MRATLAQLVAGAACVAVAYAAGAAWYWYVPAALFVLAALITVGVWDAGSDRTGKQKWGDGSGGGV